MSPASFFPLTAVVTNTRSPQITGLECARLYNNTVHAFYLHRTATIELAVAFIAFVPPSGEVRTGPEHDAAEWLTVDEAAARFFWPSARRIIRDAHTLLGRGDAGPAEDVLRVY